LTTVAGSTIDYSPVTPRDILYVFFKYKLQILIIFVASILFSLGYLLYVGPTFSAQTKILVLIGKEKSSAIDAYSGNPNVIFSERGQNINNEIEILTDKNMTYDVMPALQEYLEATYTEPTTLLQRIKKWFRIKLRQLKELIRTPFYKLGVMVKLSENEQLALSFQAALDVEFIEETDLIMLSFRWPEPNFAAFAANAYADAYVKRRIKIHDTASSEQFYLDQIGIYEDRLSGVEKELEKFRKDMQISSIDIQKDLLLREISELEKDYRVVNTTLSDLKIKLDTVRGIYENTDEWIETPKIAGIIPDLAELDKYFFDIMAERDRLLRTHTENSREVVNTTGQIAKLRKQKLESLTNFIAPLIESAQREKSTIEKKQKSKTLALQALDKSERRLKELERTRNIIQTNYLKYKEKAEDFRISEELNARRITSVRIIGKALPPEKPASPWVTLVMGLAAFLGLFLGFAYSVIAEFFDHSFRHKADVEGILGIPLLASIPDINRYPNRGTRFTEE